MPKSHRKSLYPIYTAIESFSWTIVLGCFLAWNVYQIINNSMEMMHHEARAFFKQVLVTRSWNAEHGGVYVPITQKTLPNPYLKVPERDIKSVTGQKYTLINPAFMTRQISQLGRSKKMIDFHITSLNPINPGNKADSWETTQLKKYERGQSESGEYFDNASDQKQFRYMAPLMVEKSCLRCHARQGYELGQIRGGISVTLNVVQNIQNRNKQIIYNSVTYIAIWLLGLLGIHSASKRLEEIDQKRVLTIADLNQALSKVKTLSGLIPICSKCKKIRDDKGYWSQIDAYIESHSDAEFSHGICQECSDDLYGNQDWYLKQKKNKPPANQ